MTKTPEELTADWKAGKLDWNKFYYIKLTSGEICIDYANGAYFENDCALALQEVNKLDEKSI